MLASGCAGPWAKTTELALPTSSTTPTTLAAIQPKVATLPHVEQENRAAAVDALQQALEQPATELGNNLSETQGDAQVTNVKATSGNASELTVRGQTPGAYGSGSAQTYVPSTSSASNGMSSYTPTTQSYSPSSYGPGSYSTGSATSPGGGFVGDPSYQSPVYSPGTFGDPAAQGGGYGPNQTNYDGSGIASEQLPAEYADLVVNLQETQTGSFMFGVGVNSDLGLSAQAIINERNFDWRRWPRNLNEIINGTAWRGGGQTLRIEAVPGTEVQRYLVNFTQPYLFDTPISFNVSGYLFDRRYFDWDEQRLGGRIGLGYRITPDLSLALSLRGEQVEFKRPRIRGIQQLEDVLGESDLFSGKVTLTHDTRDIPFAATQGHYLELSYEQVFGSFDYPRFNADYRRYFLLRQRADGSGRHTLSFGFRGGVTGSQTPVFENFFAGGYSTLRGFRFRHASPKVSDVIVGGQLSLLGSAEYIFPITADDMLKGALFCDYGTIEETYDNIEMDDFRVAVGAGLRISVPAMGPAPIAIDFAVPINREGTDRIQNFSFFMGMMRP